MINEPNTDTDGAAAADSAALGAYSPYLAREIERRHAALQLAHDTNDSPTKVIERASAYHSFLMGEASLPATANG